MSLDVYAGVFSNASGGYGLTTTTDWTTFANRWNESVGGPLCLTNFETYRGNSTAIWYTGVWTQQDSASSYLWRTASWSSFTEKHEEFSRDARLLDFDIHSDVGRERYYVGTWGSTPIEQTFLFDLSWQDFIQEWRALSARGFRLIRAQIHPAAPAGQFHMTGLFEGAVDPSEGYGLVVTSDWDTFYNSHQNASELQLVDYQVYDDNNDALWYLGVWRGSSSSHGQHFVFGQDYENFSSQSATFAIEGYHLQQMVRYSQAIRSPQPEWDEYLATKLKPVTQGYVYVVMKDGRTVTQGSYGYTRNDNDQLSAWSLDSRMHLASVSKAVAGVAVLKLLGDKGISVDAPFWDPYMKKQIPVVGPGVQNVTIRQLLNMTSGMEDYLQAIMFNASDYWAILSDYLANQTVTRNGIVECYSNTNFLILQGLVDSLLGNDGQSPSQYHKYVFEEILRPMGIDPTVWNFHDDPYDRATLSYSNPPSSTQEGWWFGDVQNICGAGWVANAVELAKFQIGVRNHVVLDASTTAEMLDGNLGWDHYQNYGMYGRYYHKNGNFFTEDGRGLRTGIVSLPFGYDVLLMTNTWLPALDLDPVTVIMNAFEAQSSSETVPINHNVDEDRLSFSMFVPSLSSKTDSSSDEPVVSAGEDVLCGQSGRLCESVDVRAANWSLFSRIFMFMFQW